MEKRIMMIVNEILNRIIYILLNMVSLVMYGIGGEKLSNKFDNKVNKILDSLPEEI